MYIKNKYIKGRYETFCLFLFVGDGICVSWKGEFGSKLCRSLECFQEPVWKEFWYAGSKCVEVWNDVLPAGILGDYAYASFRFHFTVDTLAPG